MRAAAALFLHILAVHYLFVLFTIGLPCLALSFYVKKYYPAARRYYIAQLLATTFFISLTGGFIFPYINLWYLENYGMKGEAVIVKTFEDAGWFNRTPEIRLVLKISPDDGPPFFEAVSTSPPLETLNHLQVGYKVDVYYAPQYTHDIAIASW